MAKKILIAEDNEDIRRLVRLSLEGSDYELFEADNGRDALEEAISKKPDLVILDVMMPKLTGYEVCKNIKANPFGESIKVLFLTSRTGITAQTAMSKAGADDIMNKPFNPSELESKVKSMLQRGGAAGSRAKQIKAQA